MIIFDEIFSIQLSVMNSSQNKCLYHDRFKILDLQFYSNVKFIIHFSWNFMSKYPILGCGLTSKPRAAEPSMFDILSWTANNDIAQSTVFECQPQSPNHVIIQKTNPVHVQNADLPSNFVSNSDPSHQPHQIQPLLLPQQQIYKQHKSTKKSILNKPNATPQMIYDINQSKALWKSHLFKKKIKNQLNSYEPIYLKASRTKSTHITKPEQTDKINTKLEQVELDQKTLIERKQKLKEFELFTRILPNSAFTTYYGKPAFENYGRGTSYQNLKSFNVMPHKGDNHPKNIQSHYTALIKARKTKSKSYLPRKPIEETLLFPQSNQNLVSIQVPSLPLEKPNLIKSKRFAIVSRDVGKKAGPPETTKQSIQSAQRTAPKARQRKSVSFKQAAGDGLKYLNKRQNLIDYLEQKKLKASQLAYKITECYPLQFQVQKLQYSQVSKENQEEMRPAGKASNKGDTIKDLIESRFLLKENKQH